MTPRGNRRLAWALASIAGLTALVGFGFALAAWHVPLPPAIFGPRAFSCYLAVVFGITGLAIVLRRPGNAVGWLALVAAAFTGLQGLADGYAVWAVAGHGSTATIARLAAIGEEWAWMPGFASAGLMFGLFPGANGVTVATDHGRTE